MPESLLDFGNVAQLAQNNLHNAMQMQQLGLRDRELGIHEQQLGLQARQTAVNEQQIGIDRQREMTARLNSMRSLMEHPLVQNNPDMQDQLFASMAPELGIPTEGLSDKLTQSRKDRMELLSATLGNDPKKATDATIKLLAGMDNDSAGKFLKNIEALPGLHAKAQIAKQQMEINEAKFSELRQNQAIVNEGRGPLTALSSVMRDQLRGTDTPQFKAMQVIFGQTGQSGVLTSTDRTFSDKNKEPFKHLLDGNAAQMAQNLQPEIDRVQYLMQTDQRALEDMDHGVHQPGQMREALTARIATNGPILGALRDMQEWYKDPLNKDKHIAAQSAYKSIENRRIELESMDKKLDQQRMNLVNLANEKFDAGQQEKIASDYAQEVFRDNLAKGVNENKAAVLAAKAVSERYPDTPYNADKLKSNKPLVDLKLNTTQTASEEAAKDFMKETRQTYNQLKQAPAVLANIEKAKALVPSAKAFMGTGGEGLLAAAKFLNNRLGAQIDVKGVTATEELQSRLFVGIMDNLKKLDSQPSQEQQRILQDALGRVGTDPNALPAVLDVYGDVVREKIDIHNNEVAGAKKNGVVFPYDPTIAYPAKGRTPSAQPSIGKAQPQQQSGAGYGNRPDGTPKGEGYFGKIPSPVNPDEFSTELTIGVNLGGKETNIPLITPNLSRSEIEAVMRGRESKEIIDKAVEHAKSRMKQGKSPYADDGEVRALPEWKPKEFDSFYQSLRKGDTYTGPDGKRRTKK